MPQQITTNSLGNHGVFACDSYGRAWYRYGVSAPAEDAFPPAWVRLEDAPVKREEKSALNFFKKTSKKGHSIDNANDLIMAPLIQIAVGGVNDEMVWAIDSKHGLHCRKGVTTDLPIGTEWVRVSPKVFGFFISSAQA